jgi:hypothetical protein
MAETNGMFHLADGAAVPRLAAAHDEKLHSTDQERLGNVE